MMLAVSNIFSKLTMSRPFILIPRAHIRMTQYMYFSTNWKTDSYTAYVYNTSADFAGVYKTYRPPYPEIAFKEMLDYHRIHGTAKFDLAVDVACGTGRSTLPLAPHFKQVVGIDVNEHQIAVCPKDVPNVEFRVGFGEELSFLEPNSVDLILVATAVQWLQWEIFCQEAKRVLAPHGTLAVLSNGPEILENNDAHQYILQMRADKFHKHLFIKSTLEMIYAKLHALKMHGMEKVWRLDGVLEKKQWSLNSYLGYLRTFYYVTRYQDEHPDEDVIGEMRRDLSKILCGEDNPAHEISLDIILETFMALGRKPAQ